MERVISAISCVCVCVFVVGAVNDGKCSLRWSATVSVVQESVWWKGNQIRDNTPLTIMTKQKWDLSQLCKFIKKETLKKIHCSSLHTLNSKLS